MGSGVGVSGMMRKRSWVMVRGYLKRVKGEWALGAVIMAGSMDRPRKGIRSCVEGHLELEAVIGRGWGCGPGAVLGSSEPEWANGCGSQSWQRHGQALYNYRSAPGVARILGLRSCILRRLHSLHLRLRVPVWQIPELYPQRSTLCLCQSLSRPCPPLVTCPLQLQRDTSPWAGLPNGFISRRLCAANLAWARVVYLSCWASGCV